MKARRLALGVAASLLAVVAVTSLALSWPSGREARPPTDPPDGGADPAASTIATEYGTVEYVIPEEKIVAIDDPSFLAVGSVADLATREPVLAVSVGDDTRAYPLRYLIFHEIVNDTVGGVPLVVTYCPLCNTGIVFRRPEADGRLLDFGVSGRLLNGNLVMVDRQTSSLWSQALGEAVSGELEGAHLEFEPAQIVSWKQWRGANPGGTVLAEPDVAALPRGVRAPYGTNPYIGYDRTRHPPIPDERLDDRLRPTARVLSVGSGSRLVGVPYSVLRSRSIRGRAASTIRVGNGDVVVLWQRGTSSAIDAGRLPDSRDVGAASAFSTTLNGRRLTIEATRAGFVDRETSSRWDIFGSAISGPLRGERLEPIVTVDHLWFEWAAFNPDARVVGLNGSG